jgi:hypothetical protein
MNTQIKANGVNLFPCDDGLLMVFVPVDGESVKVTMDWVALADFALRLDTFGKEALTMMQIGLDPYKSSHRQQFSEAGWELILRDGGAI